MLPAKAAIKQKKNVILTVSSNVEPSVNLLPPPVANAFPSSAVAVAAQLPSPRLRSPTDPLSSSIMRPSDNRKNFLWRWDEVHFRQTHGRKPFATPRRRLPSTTADQFATNGLDLNPLRNYMHKTLFKMREVVIERHNARFLYGQVGLPAQTSNGQFAYMKWLSLSDLSKSLERIAEGYEKVPRR